MTGLDLLELVNRWLPVAFFLDLTLFTFGLWGFSKLRGRARASPHR